MFDLCQYMLARFGVASVFLAITCVAALVLIRVLRCRAPFIHSAIWCVVLVQGVLVFQVPVSVQSPYRSLPIRVSASGSEPLPSSDADADPALDDRIVTSPSDGWQWRFSWPIYVLVAWIGGIAVILCRWAFAYFKLVQSVDGEVCDLKEWNREWDVIQRENGISKLIPLFVSIGVGPFLCWHPTGYRVVVPFSLWHQLSKQQREAVLLHELAHYKRGDVFKVFVAQLLVLPHWFNPFAWLAMRKFENSVEWGCDDVVRNSTPDAAIHFAQALLEIADLSNRRLALTSPMNGGGVSQRIRRTLSNDIGKDSGIKNGLALGLLVSLLLLHTVRVNLIAQEPDRLPAEEEAKSPEQLQKEFEESDEYKLLMDSFMYLPKNRVRDPAQLAEKNITTRLALCGDKITDDTLKQVSKLNDLKSIGIFQSRVTGLGLKHLANLEEIEEVVFTGPRVTDVWLSNMPAWPKLRNVRLNDSKITDSGLHKLERYPTIRSLVLRHTAIGDSGLEVLEHLPVLTFLDLINTQVSDKGLAHLRHTPHIYGLSLSSPNIRGPGLAHLLELNDIGKIRFSGENVTSEWLRPIEPLRDVYRLSLSKTRVTDAGLSAIEKWTHLERLYITDETITDGAVESLRHLSGAKEINLRTRIGIDGIKRLRELLPDAAIGDGRVAAERK